MRGSILIWILVLIVAALFVDQVPRDAITANLMDLLPHDQRDMTVQRALDTVSLESRRQVFFLVSAKNRAGLVEQARQLQSLVDASGFFKSGSANRYNPSALFRYRYVLLTAADRKRLVSGGVIAQARKELFGPAGAVRAISLQKDPAFLFQHYVESLLPASLDNSLGFPSVDQGGEYYGLIARQLKGTSSGILQMRKLWSFITALEKNAALNVEVTGYPVFSAYGASTAQREITIIGSISMLAIILIILLVFRRILPLLLVIVSITGGALVAAVVTFAVFGRVHIMALVAGTSLIGVSIDYSFHYFCHRFNDGNVEVSGGTGGVIRGLTLGMVSSVSAYLLLTVAPFPGLRQIAVFSASGLFVTWLMVITLYPAVYKPKRPKPDGSRVNEYRADALADAINRLSWKLKNNILNHRKLFVVALGVFLVIGIFRVKPADDVRQLQSAPLNLRSGDAKIRSVFPDLPDSRFLLVEGSSSAQVSQISRKVASRLDALKRSGDLTRYQSLVDAWPTVQAQRSNYNLLRRNLYDNGHLAAWLASLGVAKGAIDAEYKKFQKQAGVTVTADEWEKRVPPPWNLLWLGCKQGQCGGIILLYGINDPGRIAGIAKQISGVKFVDQVRAISTVMHDTRIHASWLLGLAALVLFVVLAPILGGLASLKVLAVPTSAILCSLAMTGYFGVPVSLFNIFALLLVLGIGVDYAIFNHLAGSHDRYLGLAVLLSACTTILSFGLLSFSSTTALSAFGLTLLFGIAAALVLSNLVRSGDWRAG